MIEIKEQSHALMQVNNIMGYFAESGCAIRPHFFMTGPTGSGKSYIIQQVAEKLKLGFLEINAAQLTREGISGNSLSKALAPLRSMDDVPTVVFVDEFDKLLSTHGSADEARLGVQDEFLKVIESDYLSVFGDYGKYARVRADNILFVFAGVFGDKGDGQFEPDELRELGLRSEFLGRVGLTVSTNKIPLDTLLNHVDKSDLLNHYLKLHPNVNRSKAVAAIKKDLKANDHLAAAGFRAINTSIHKHFILNKPAAVPKKSLLNSIKGLN